MKILVTGAAGFIGFHLVTRLLKEGHEVVGLDNFNDYYPRSLKYDRSTELGLDETDITYNKIVKSNRFEKYRFIQLQLEDDGAMALLFKDEKFDVVCNLAAQAGVRYSIQNPKAYISSNVVGFLNILEGCRHNKVKHLVFASSSSVYGLNKKTPFSVKDNVDQPISLYAATKKSNELMAHTYSHLYNLPSTGLRFFTVYGPWGRPDMSYSLFADAILKRRPIKVFNEGKMLRDFTFVDDIVEGVVRIIHKGPKKVNSKAQYKIYNIGNGTPIELLYFIELVEKNMGEKVKRKMLPLQPGDVVDTFADVSELENDYQYKPKTSIETGLKKTLDWYKEYYGGPPPTPPKEGIF